MMTKGGPRAQRPCGGCDKYPQGTRPAMRPLLALAGLALLAGCFGSSPAEPASPPVPEPQRLSDYIASRPLHSLESIEPFEVAAQDGTPLRGHVYIPKAGGAVPTVLEFSPYFNAGSGPGS